MQITRFEPSSILCNAVVHGNIAYLAGIVAGNPEADVKGQTVQVLDQIDHLLALCDSHKSRILTATIWLPNMSDRAAMNEAWNAWLDKENLPARACVEAKLASPKYLVEIMVTAASTGQRMI